VSRSHACGNRKSLCITVCQMFKRKTTWSSAVYRRRRVLEVYWDFANARDSLLTAGPPRNLGRRRCGSRVLDVRRDRGVRQGSLHPVVTRGTKPRSARAGPVAPDQRGALVVGEISRMGPRARRERPSGPTVREVPRAARRSRLHLKKSPRIAPTSSAIEFDGWSAGVRVAAPSG